MSNIDTAVAELMEQSVSKEVREAKIDPAELEDLLMRYEAAMREVRTKLEILNDELSLKGYDNPIKNIFSRRKKTENIIEKLHRQGDPISPGDLLRVRSV